MLLHQHRLPGAIKSAVISGTEVKSPIIGTAYLAAEPGAKKFALKLVKKLKKVKQL